MTLTAGKVCAAISWLYSKESDQWRAKWRRSGPKIHDFDDRHAPATEDWRSLEACLSWGKLNLHDEGSLMRISNHSSGGEL